MSETCNLRDGPQIHEAGWLQTRKRRSVGMADISTLCRDPEDHTSEMDPNAQLNLILLGKKQVGKSSTGNTILGREAFVSKKSSRSVTRDVAVESGTVNGFPVTVYDTPGLSNADMREEEIQEKYKEVLLRCESCACVFLLVIKADSFTEEERKTVEKIEELLGEERLEKTWILFTRGDELEEENMTIKEFINDNEQLKKLVQKYEQRYHVFNNKTESTDQNRLLLANILHRSFSVNEEETLTRTIPDSRAKAHNEPDTAVSSLSSRRIVLLGKTGFGKSASGNTILGQDEFNSEMNMSSVTSECSVKHGTVSGRSVSVIDTPGLFDTQMKFNKLMKKIARSVYISSPGPHAFLIVFRVIDRFTVQEQKIPQIIEMMFGPEVLKYSIILFTHGDLLVKSIEKLIQESSNLRDLVQRCGGRYHVFNNKAQNDREQVNDLLQKIDSMIEQNGGGHYSNQMYEDAQRLRLEEEERKQREKEEREQREEKQLIERVRKEKTPEFKQFYRKYRSKWYIVAFAIGHIATGQTIGACIGGTIGLIGGPVGVAAGVVVGGAVGGAVGAVVSKFRLKFT